MLIDFLLQDIVDAKVDVEKDVLVVEKDVLVEL